MLWLTLFLWLCTGVCYAAGTGRVKWTSHKDHSRCTGLALAISEKRGPCLAVGFWWWSLWFYWRGS